MVQSFGEGSDQFFPELDIDLFRWEFLDPKERFPSDGVLSIELGRKFLPQPLGQHGIKNVFFELHVGANLSIQLIGQSNRSRHIPLLQSLAQASQASGQLLVVFQKDIR